MRNRQRVGIFGGSFNPVHLGHLITAQCAIEQFDLNRVWFMPCNRQPLKQGSQLAAARHRLAMLDFAITDNLQFEILDLEIKRGGISYAVDSMEALSEAHPDAYFYFLIGADSLPDLHRWYRIERLLELCSFATLARPGTDLSCLTPEKLNLPGNAAETVLKNVAPGCLVDISSSDIRHRVAEAMSIRYLVPPQVEMYICEHGLYQGDG